MPVHFSYYPVCQIDVILPINGMNVLNLHHPYATITPPACDAEMLFYLESLCRRIQELDVDSAWSELERFAGDASHLVDEVRFREIAAAGRQFYGAALIYAFCVDLYVRREDAKRGPPTGQFWTIDIREDPWMARFILFGPKGPPDDVVIDTGRMTITQVSQRLTSDLIIDALACL